MTVLVPVPEQEYPLGGLKNSPWTSRVNSPLVLADL